LEIAIFENGLYNHCQQKKPAYKARNIFYVTKPHGISNLRCADGCMQKISLRLFIESILTAPGA
jgi:hypothetical protein